MSEQSAFNAPLSWQQGKLNLDIYRHIMSCINRPRDLVLFMSACHQFYTAGMFYLLAFPTVLFEIKHCYLMLYDAPTSGRYLKSLEICCNKLSARKNQDLLKQLAEVLKHTCILETLIFGSYPYFIEVGSPLFESLSKLTSLKKFSCNRATTPCITSLLRKLHSPIERFGLFDFECDNGDITNIVDLLRNFASTVRDIRTSQVTVELSDVSYPAVYSLRVDSTATLMVTPYIISFPNLKRLCFFSLGVDTDMTDEGLLLLRTENQRTQAQNKTWPTLDFIESSLFQLYALGLTCRITYIHLLHIMDAYIDLLELVIRSACPSRLHFYLHLNDINLQAIPTLVPNDSATKITHFGIFLHFLSSNSRRQVIDTFRHLITLIKKMPLEYLLIEIFWLSGIGQQNPNTLWLNQEFGEILEMAQNFAKELPHLQHVFISIRENECQSAGWSISRVDDDEKTILTKWEDGLGRDAAMKLMDSRYKFEDLRPNVKSVDFSDDDSYEYHSAEFDSEFDSESDRDGDGDGDGDVRRLIEEDSTEEDNTDEDDEEQDEDDHHEDA